jgi:hypothetical protein
MEVLPISVRRRNEVLIIRGGTTSEMPLEYQSWIFTYSERPKERQINVGSRDLPSTLWVGINSKCECGE